MNNRCITNLGHGNNPTDAVSLQQVESLIGTTEGLAAILSNSNDAGSQKIINLAPGTNPTDAVNLSQLSAVSTPSLSTTLTIGNSVGSNQINMNSQKIINLAPGTNATDAVNFGQLSSIPASTLSSTLTTGNSAGSNQINMNSQKIVNLAPGTNATDAVNFGQLSSIPASTLSSTLATGNSAGSNSINMNNQSITNSSQIQTNLIIPNNATTGISYFVGSGPSSLKSMYAFSGVMNNSNTTTILSLNLNVNSTYTMYLVGGYYCSSGPSIESSGSYMTTSKIRVNNTTAIKTELTTNIYSDLSGADIATAISGTVTLDINLTGVVNNTLNFTGTLELWRHY